MLEIKFILKCIFAPIYLIWYLIFNREETYTPIEHETHTPRKKRIHEFSDEEVLQHHYDYQAILNDRNKEDRQRKTIEKAERLLREKYNSKQ